MCKIENYQKLKKEFGEYASWAVWADNDIGDWSVLTDENILQLAKPAYVFVGLNAAKHNNPKEVVDWSNFHSKDAKRQKDHKLRHALLGTKYWGSYITDIIKGYEETDSKKVEEFVKNNPNEYKENIDRFRYEMQLLAGDKKPVLIALGGAAYKMLKPLAKEFAILQIPHYAARFYGYGDPDFYKARVHEILEIE